MRTAAEEWIDVVGCTWEEYTQPIRDLYAQHEGDPTFDRDSCFRDDFNKRVGPNGARNFEAVAEFYGDPNGIFARLVAYEQGAPDDKSPVLKAIATGHAQFEWSALAFARDEAARRFGDDGVIMLDHGAGPCSLGLSVADSYKRAKVILYDFPLPLRQVIGRMMPRYLQDRVSFSWAPTSGPFFRPGVHFNLVTSQEVLEHCVDPFGELSRIASNMVKGGVIYLSTFFNDVEGKNPSHLSEHHGYQDTPIYLKAIEDCGFQLIGRDINGCERVFEKV